MKYSFLALLTLISLGALAQTSKTPKFNQPVYTVADSMPQYPGGKEAFDAFVAKNIIYPNRYVGTEIRGYVKTVVTIEADGSVGDISIQTTPTVDYVDEAKRLIRSAAKWKPGIKDGRAVRVKCVVPVYFNP